MSNQAPLTFRRYRGPDARDVRTTVEAIYRDSYSLEQQADPFNSPETWMHRFDAYTSGSGFDLVIAYADQEPAGQAWGWPLTARSRWWTGLVAEPEPRFTEEDGTRTFALSEIMVRSQFTGQGIAHALHDELLAGRHEKRATLLVEADNTVAYRAYESWGWQRAAQLRPDWPDAPLFDVLTLVLPVQ